MADQCGLCYNGTEPPRFCQSDHGDHHMNEQDDEVAHPGNSNNTSQPAVFRPICQFAMDTYAPFGAIISTPPAAVQRNRSALLPPPYDPTTTLPSAETRVMRQPSTNALNVLPGPRRVTHETQH